MPALPIELAVNTGGNGISATEDKDDIASRFGLPQPASTDTTDLLLKMSGMTREDQQLNVKAAPTKIVVELNEEQKNDPNNWMKYEAVKKELAQELRRGRIALKEEAAKNEEGTTHKKAQGKQALTRLSRISRKLRREIVTIFEQRFRRRYSGRLEGGATDVS